MLALLPARWAGPACRHSSIVPVCKRYAGLPLSRFTPCLQRAAGGQDKQQPQRQQRPQRRRLPAMHAVGSSGGSAAAAAGAAAVVPSQLPAIDATTLTVEPGQPTPLGASPGQDGQKGVNFALWAPAATSVTLCLHDDQDRPIMETLMQRTGDTWHAFVAGLPQVGRLQRL